MDIKSLEPGSAGVDAVCPETHFWCPDKDFCLPVFVRCNSVYDCPGHEDEEGCDVYTCPGFYRCRASKVCVPVTHVCDDWPLCPQRDDEWLCNQACPPQCTCHGLAFFCNQTFEARQFPDLRYLDVRGTGMDVDHLGHNHMLIHLSLAQCNVTAVGNFTLSNLHSLDLSDNLLTEVSGDHLVHMPQLSVLFLAGNPLTRVFPAPADSGIELPNINMLDLSRVKTLSVDHSLFTTLSALHTLNLSHSGVELPQWRNSNMSDTSLRKLDLRGCTITQFPRDALNRLVLLQVLFTDSFRLCCRSVLPPGFDLNQCHVTPDEVSSCDNLLGSVTYRAAVAVLATLVFVGNVTSLMLRVCVGSAWRLSSSGVVLTHLSVADLGTGLYLATLGLADHLLAGDYVWQDITWRRGAVCHLSGVLTVSCRHAATFFIAILSLDRCLHSWHTVVPRLNLAKVRVLCVVVWGSSLSLSAVPMTAGWQLFGQQALCVPLPHKRNHSLETQYVYAVQVLVHFTVFVLCSVGEVINGLLSRGAKFAFMNKAHLPMDFLFVLWGSLASGFLYTTASLVPTDSHSYQQKAMHTALVFFASVVSSSMNPYLHLYGVWLERSNRIKEERLMRIVNRARC